MNAKPSSCTIAAKLAGLFLLAAMTLPDAAHAGESVTFFVDSTADAPDADAADGTCSSNVADPDTPSCTLRAAIMQGNAMPLATTVNIRLAGGELYTVSGGDSVADASGSVGDLEIARRMDIRTAPSTNPATITGMGIDRLFDIRTGASGTTISAMSLSNDSLSEGCILSTQQGAGALTLDHLEIRDSICGSQGALYLTNTPTTIRNSYIHHGNRVLWSVGGIVTIERSTFHANADLPNLVFTNGSVVNVIDSTFSDNYKPLTARDSELFVIHSTFTGSELEHIAFKTPTPTKNFQLRNSLLSEAGTTNCAYYGSGDVQVDITGSVYVSGTVSDDISCIANSPAPSAANLYNASVALTVLGDHGGPTLTHELLPDSDGIDWIPPSHCNAAATDQRGYPRAVSYSGDDPAYCDAGATELQVGPPVLPGHIFGDGFEGE